MLRPESADPTPPHGCSTQRSGTPKSDRAVPTPPPRHSSYASASAYASYSPPPPKFTISSNVTKEDDDRSGTVLFGEELLHQITAHHLLAREARDFEGLVVPLVDEPQIAKSIEANFSTYLHPYLHTYEGLQLLGHTCLRVESEGVSLSKEQINYLMMQLELAREETRCAAAGGCVRLLERKRKSQ